MPLPSKFSRVSISSLTLAVVLGVALVLWLMSGERMSASEEPPAPQAVLEEGLPRVETQWYEAALRPGELVAQGQILPWQQVSVQAKVAGTVVQLLQQQGDLVAAGEPLLKLSDEGRTQQLAQAQAALQLKQGELASATTLRQSEFLSEAEQLRLQSELEGTKAELVTADLAVQYAEPVAPFDGIVDRRHVELGDWVTPGAELIDVVDVQRLKVTAQIPQQEAGRVAVGQPVMVMLLDGRELQGEVRFVSNSADPSTRTFYMEATAANPELWRVAGASASLRVQLPPALAHTLSPALLSLDESGKLGVRAVDEQNRVVFYPVKLLSINSDEASIAGLPERVRIITLGAGFVQIGQEVDARGAGE